MLKNLTDSQECLWLCSVGDVMDYILSFLNVDILVGFWFVWVLNDVVDAFCVRQIVY